MSLFASWHLVLHWGYLSKVTLVLENSSVQLEGTFLHCLDKEEPDWVECVGVRGQRNNSSGFFFFLRIILNCLSLFQGADSLLDISSEADQQELLVLLQAKVASLTLHNKELQDKLQVGK